MIGRNSKWYFVRRHPRRHRATLAAAAFACLAVALTAHGQEFLDQLDEKLTLSVLNDQLRAHLSGTLDLEYYHFQQPAPALIDSHTDNLFNPRLILFLDAQAGSWLYGFIQTRFDQAFDPRDHGGGQVRLDEYALRLTPWSDGRFSIQIGKFATVVGNFVPRHLSWENPFVTAPLVYENVTGLEDRTGMLELNFERALTHEKYELIPVIWGPSYATGASISGRLGEFDYAAEVKNRALSSRPETWDPVSFGFDHPTVSGRIGYRPSQMWTFGLSASEGSYLRPDAEAFLPRGRNVGDYQQKLLGQDISFAWHHLQLWAEFYETRFEIPRLGDADTFAWYIEAKYKFAPQFFAALRFNQQVFSTVDTARGSLPLGADAIRLDVAGTYRFTTRTHLKLQYSFLDPTSSTGETNHIFAAQFTIRF